MIDIAYAARRAITELLERATGRELPRRRSKVLLSWNPSECRHQIRRFETGNYAEFFGVEVATLLQCEMTVCLLGHRFLSKSTCVCFGLSRVNTSTVNARRFRRKARSH